MLRPAASTVRSSSLFSVTWFVQVRLEPRVKKEILSELRTPDRIRENLDVVDIVIGFLSSGGGKTEKPLGEYVDRVLRMKRRPFSRKVRGELIVCVRKII